MDQKTLIEIISTREFWFITVFAAIIVSIVANFATDYLKQVYALVSQRQKQILEAREKAFQIEVQSLIDSKVSLQDTKVNAIYEFLRDAVNLLVLLLIQNASYSNIFSMFSRIFDVILPFAISVWAVYIALRIYYRHKKVSAIINEYEARAYRDSNSKVHNEV